MSAGSACEDTQFGVGVGGQTGNRNSPVAYNRILSAVQFWDGRAATLEEQAKGPIANPIEMSNTHDVCVQHLADIEGYRPQFEKIFPDGVTPNDAGDVDTGPNNVQNFPVLTSANSTLAGTTIAGTLNSTPNTTFTIQIFSDSSCDPSGNGEGQLFVGSTSIATDPGGNLNFSQLFPAVVADQHVVSATATDSNGNTSEFSQAYYTARFSHYLPLTYR